MQNILCSSPGTNKSPRELAIVVGKIKIIGAESACVRVTQFA